MRARLVFSIIFISILSIAVSAQGRSTVSGYVYGPQNAPVERAQVELMDDLNSVIARTWTEASGRFRFNGVPSGRLAVRVVVPGADFGEQTQDFEISGIGIRGQSIPDNIQLEFHLRPRKPSSKAATGVVFAQDVPEPARKLFLAAASDLDAGRSTEGIDGLKKALEAFPTYFLAMERLAFEYLRLERFEDARKVLRDAVAVNDDSFQIWYGLAYTEYAANKYKDAVAAAERALTLDKSSPNAAFVLGLSQRKLKLYKDAEKSMLQAKRFDNGKTPEINWNLALLYAYNLKRYPAAADELELYLKALPQEPNAEKIRKLIKDLRENRPPQSLPSPN
ncbi:MAG: tetratricopeptide repeat protein [Acidobacteriota bacterium]